jgi:hypothetical protein
MQPLISLVPWLGRENFVDWINPLGFMFNKSNGTFRLLNNHYRIGVFKLPDLLINITEIIYIKIHYILT